MSYDLYFYKRKDSGLTEEAFAGYLSATLKHNISDYDRQWNYENPETGVYFLIDWNEPDTDPEYIADFCSFTEFDNLNFSFSINFIRPDFFAYEIFPIIEQIVTDLDLFVLNPQDDVNSEYPLKFSAGYLQEQWILQNKQISIDKYNEFNINYFDLKKSDELWQYQYIREELQDSLTEDIFVAGVLLFKPDDGSEPITACVWPKHIPIILPPVDYLIIQKKYRKFFRDIEKRGFIPYSQIMDKLGQSFVHFEYRGLILKKLTQDKADTLASQFNSLPITEDIKALGTMMRTDAFVNHKL